ncbi:MAG: hypothetical protein QME42_00695 [bacterium]|nr:hypothetical protein [bacterium]
MNKTFLGIKLKSLPNITTFGITTLIITLLWGIANFFLKLGKLKIVKQLLVLGVACFFLWLINECSEGLISPPSAPAGFSNLIIIFVQSTFLIYAVWLLIKEKNILNKED